MFFVLKSAQNFTLFGDLPDEVYANKILVITLNRISLV